MPDKLLRRESEKRRGEIDKHVRFDKQPEKGDTTANHVEVEKPNKPPKSRNQSRNSNSDTVQKKAAIVQQHTVTKSGRAKETRTLYGTQRVR